MSLSYNYDSEIYLLFRYLLSENFLSFEFQNNFIHCQMFSQVVKFSR